jgi:hypothetical protein
MGVEASKPEISEEQLTEDQSAVRWATVQRYEFLYTLAVGQIEGARTSGRPVDPRWAEFALRVQKEQAAIYRLSRPPAVVEEEQVVSAVDAAAVVERQLAELELKRVG